MGDERSTWQIGIIFGPCTEDEAHDVLDEMVGNGGFGAAYSLERLDETDDE